MNRSSVRIRWAAPFFLFLQNETASGKREGAPKQIEVEPVEDSRKPIGMRNLAILWLPVLAVFLSSCETTQSGYGFIADQFDHQAILEMFATSDEAANARDYAVYKDLFAPGYYSIDKSDSFDGMMGRMNRFDYLEMVEDIFRRAKELRVHSDVTDIEFTEPGRRATVSVQEDNTIDYMGRSQRLVSVMEYTVGFEDGWIFIENATVLAKNEIDE